MEAKREAIKEEQGVHKQWHDEAKGMTLEALPAFLSKLVNEYEHDYGTICHAITAAGIAAMNAVNKSDQGGITGFQAGCVQWEFLRQWGLVEYPAAIIQYKNLLYPQYEDRFTSISTEIWAEVQKLAAAHLEDSGRMHQSVHDHMQRIVAGVVPFGLKVRSD